MNRILIVARVLLGCATWFAVGWYAHTPEVVRHSANIALHRPRGCEDAYLFKDVEIYDSPTTTYAVSLDEGCFEFDSAVPEHFWLVVR